MCRRYRSTYRTRRRLRWAFVLEVAKKMISAMQQVRMATRYLSSPAFRLADISNKQFTAYTGSVTSPYCATFWALQLIASLSVARQGSSTSSRSPKAVSDSGKRAQTLALHGPSVGRDNLRHSGDTARACSLLLKASVYGLYVRIFRSLYKDVYGHSSSQQLLQAKAFAK